MFEHALNREHPHRQAFHLALQQAWEDGEPERMAELLERLKQEPPLREEAPRQEERLFIKSMEILLALPRLSDAEAAEMTRQLFFDPQATLMRHFPFGTLRAVASVALISHLKLGRHETAAAIAYGASELEGEEHELDFHHHRGIAFKLRGNLEMAEYHFQRALLAAPDDDNVRRNLESVREERRKSCPEK